MNNPAEEQTILRLTGRSIPLRRAEPADVAAITALVRDAYMKWVPLMGVAPVPMLADYTEAIRDHRVDLCEEAGRLVALIETHATSDYLFIVNIAVSPERQRSGIGGALLAHAETVATSCGLCTVRLFVNQVMAGNIRLYARHGYRTDRDVPFRGGTVLHMSKQLA